jgi:hypothetical protein
MAGYRWGSIFLLISVLLFCVTPSTAALHGSENRGVGPPSLRLEDDRDNHVAGPPSLSLEEAMDMVLKMEAKPEFVKSTEYDELGKFLPASQVLHQVCVICCLEVVVVDVSYITHSC